MTVMCCARVRPGQCSDMRSGRRRRSKRVCGRSRLGMSASSTGFSPRVCDVRGRRCRPRRRSSQVESIRLSARCSAMTNREPATGIPTSAGITGSSRPEPAPVRCCTSVPGKAQQTPCRNTKPRSPRSLSRTGDPGYRSTRQHQSGTVDPDLELDGCLRLTIQLFSCFAESQGHGRRLARRLRRTQPALIMLSTRPEGARQSSRENGAKREIGRATLTAIPRRANLLERDADCQGRLRIDPVAPVEN